MFKLNFINNFLGRNQVPYKANCKKKEIPITAGTGYNDGSKKSRGDYIWDNLDG